MSHTADFEDAEFLVEPCRLRAASADSSGGRERGDAAGIEPEHEKQEWEDHWDIEYYSQPPLVAAERSRGDEVQGQDGPGDADAEAGARERDGVLRGWGEDEAWNVEFEECADVWGIYRGGPPRGAEAQGQCRPRDSNGFNNSRDVEANEPENINGTGDRESASPEHIEYQESENLEDTPANGLENSGHGRVRELGGLWTNYAARYQADFFIAGGSSREREIWSGMVNQRIGHLPSIREEPSNDSGAFIQEHEDREQEDAYADGSMYSCDSEGNPCEYASPAEIQQQEDAESVSLQTHSFLRSPASSPEPEDASDTDAVTPERREPVHAEIRRSESSQYTVIQDLDDASKSHAEIQAPDNVAPASTQAPSPSPPTATEETPASNEPPHIRALRKQIASLHTVIAKDRSQIAQYESFLAQVTQRRRAIAAKLDAGEPRLDLVAMGRKKLGEMVGREEDGWKRDSVVGRGWGEEGEEEGETEEGDEEEPRVLFTVGDV